MSSACLLLNVRPGLRIYKIFWQNICFYSKIGNYSDTIKVPKTDFPLSLKTSVIHERELEIQEKCQFEKLYEWQSSQNRSKNFTLHDGPPYANGRPHVGHALNKILKDITNRYKLLRGYKIHYVPGWDCHGTPIEQKALTGMNRSRHPMEVRKVAKEFAMEAARNQKSAFKRWGIMADWQNNCYYTLDPKYETGQLEAFLQLYEKGLVYQEYMPVFWSPTSKSALAEAEIEYKEDFESTQVYMRFPLLKYPTSWSVREPLNKFYAVIWTTTPWTLPLNKAICYGEGLSYCVLKDPSTNEGYLVSQKFSDEFCQMFGKKLIKILEFPGNELRSGTYLSTNGVEAPLLPANHVTSEKGTGLVHTAPAHGVEDFQVALKSGLSLECQVDEEGRYKESLGMPYHGKFVLKDGSEEVLKQMSENILHQSKLRHCYPLDWRTKQPILIRASLQWFINTQKIKDAAAKVMEGVSVYPSMSSRGMMSELERRDYWCISRQRVWGIPVPVFIEKQTKEILINRHSINHLKKLFVTHGSDCWWSLPLNQLLPREVIEKSGFSESSEFECGRDILDIWFDSGVSWMNVLGDCKENVADVYLEGLDQFGGWFMSSLLTSVALQNKAPFKKLVVHGFALDEEGRKMSKSLGNVVDPATVVEGGQGSPSYGVDVMRMWAAHSGLDVAVAIGPSVLDGLHQKLFKFRKSLRFLTGCLHDFKVEYLEEKQVEELNLNDRFMLDLLQDVVDQVTSAYEEFNFSKVLRVLDWFNSSQVSAFYCHIIKDRLYCGHSEERLSSQIVIFHILNVFTKLLAPIVPHLCEEIYMYHPMKSVGSSIFKTCDWPSKNWSYLSVSSLYTNVLPIRDALYGMLGSEKPARYDLTIHANRSILDELQVLRDDRRHASFTSPLCELLQTASVVLLPSSSSLNLDGIFKVHQEMEFSLLLKKAQGTKCLRCRRNVADLGHELCQRCVQIVS